MSVYVSDFSNWTVMHDDAPGGSHTGTIDPTSIHYTENMDQTPNPDFLTVECPVCHSVSTHPVGGGAQPAKVQELFIRMTLREGWTRSAVDAIEDVKKRCNQMDGEGRFQVDEATLKGLGA
jgi:hypothetical protein